MNLRPCSCGFLDPAPVLTGAYRDGDRLVSLGYTCRRCGSDCGIPIENCTPAQIEEALLAEKARYAQMGWI